MQIPIMEEGITGNVLLVASATGLKECAGEGL